MVRYLSNYYYQGNEERNQVEEINSLFLISVFRKFSLDELDYTFDNDAEILKQFSTKHLAIRKTNPHYNHV